MKTKQKQKSKKQTKQTKKRKMEKGWLCYLYSMVPSYIIILLYQNRKYQPIDPIYTTDFLKTCLVWDTFTCIGMLVSSKGNKKSFIATKKISFTSTPCIDMPVIPRDHLHFSSSVTLIWRMVYQWNQS